MFGIQQPFQKNSAQCDLRPPSWSWGLRWGGGGAAQRRPPQGPGKGTSFTPHDVGTPAEGARPQRWNLVFPCSWGGLASSALCPESWPHADPLPMGPNSSVNSCHSDENHLSLSLWGSPGFYKYPPDYQLDHIVLPSTAPSCHRLGSPFTRCFSMSKGPHRVRTCFSMWYLAPETLKPVLQSSVINVLSL